MGKIENTNIIEIKQDIYAVTKADIPSSSIDDLIIKYKMLGNKIRYEKVSNNGVFSCDTKEIEENTTLLYIPEIETKKVLVVVPNEVTKLEPIKEIDIPTIIANKFLKFIPEAIDYIGCMNLNDKDILALNCNCFVSVQDVAIFIGPRRNTINSYSFLSPFHSKEGTLDKIYGDEI